MSKTAFKNKYGPWVLLAGAAEGLGKAYTLELAKRGMNVILVDRQEDQMKALALQVESEFGIQTIGIAIDLAQANAAKEIMHEIRGIDCGLLIYNAAFSSIKSFSAYSEEELESFIDVNTRTPLKLVHAFIQQLTKHDRPGGILMMSSLSGLIGMQLIAPYAATKAFTWNLAESLHHELYKYKIDIMSCIAGPVATPAYLATAPRYGWIKPRVMNPGNVAKQALSKLGKRTLFIPGSSNSINYFLLTRILPRKVASGFANRIMERMYAHKRENFT